MGAGQLPGQVLTSLRRTLVVVAAAVACRGDVGTDPNTPFGGDYALVSLNGARPPIVSTWDGVRSILESQVLRVAADGTWRLDTDQRYELAPGYSEPDYIGQLRGTWTREPTTGRVTFLLDWGVTLATGESTGNVLTLTSPTSDGMQFISVYRR